MGWRSNRWFLLCHLPLEGAHGGYTSAGVYSVEEWVNGWESVEQEALIS